MHSEKNKIIATQIAQFLFSIWEKELLHNGNQAAASKSGFPRDYPGNGTAT